MWQALARAVQREDAMMQLTKRWIGGVLVGVLLTPGVALAAQTVKVEGYAEWRNGEVLIVEGQRVWLARDGTFKGEGDATDFSSIPLGYEVKAEGTRLGNGIIMASKVEAKPNGDAMFEGDLVQAFNEIESQYIERGQVFQQDQNGNVQVIGKLLREGPQVVRARRIAANLTPLYLSPSDFRVYVIENDEWNAMAAPNRSIYVFSGLLEDMNDDEVATVLGHELVHATHEHSRRQFRRNMIIQLAALGIVAAAETIDSTTQRSIVQVATMLGMSAWSNGYGRSHEDQADIVGMRYAYEGGYDVSVGPQLWQRFADKYGDQNRALNFFFGDHSVAEARAKNLQQEYGVNYVNAPRIARTERSVESLAEGGTAPAAGEQPRFGDVQYANEQEELEAWEAEKARRQREERHAWEQQQRQRGQEPNPPTRP
jgi:hypothetical protein